MGKSLKKAFKSVAKAVKRTTKSYLSSGIDGVGSLLKGDIGGVADAATRAVTYGTVSLADKGLIKSNIIEKQPKETVQVVDRVVQPGEFDGLLAYVNEQRNRKAKRNRASTNNTNGSAPVNGNQLSGTTALGV